MPTERIKGERFYISPDDGGRYLSVTSLLSRGSDLPNAPSLKIAGKAAALKGTDFHAAMEAYLRNEEPDLSDSLTRYYFGVVQRHLDEHVDQVHSIEQTLYSNLMHLAGRCDLIASWDGELSIIDFKTSRRLKTKEEIVNYFMQTSYYSMMLFEMHRILPRRIVIVMVTEEISEPLIFVDDPGRYVRPCLDFVEQYHVKIAGRQRSNDERAEV